MLFGESKNEGLRKNQDGKRGGGRGGGANKYRL
jgi:hypothetical protein